MNKSVRLDILDAVGEYMKKHASTALNGADYIFEDVEASSDAIELVAKIAEIYFRH